MTRMLSIVTLLALPALVNAEDMTDATEILRKVDAASLKVKSATYHVTFEGTGDLAARAGKFSGTYTIEGWAESGPKRWFAKVEGTMPGSTDVLKFEAGGNGESYFLIDHQKKKAYEDMDPEVLGSVSRIFMAGLVSEFVHPTPFTQEIEGDKRELKGTKVVNKEPCYEIHVIYAGGMGEAIWGFSKADFLPRSRLDVFKREGMDGGQSKVLSELKIDPKLDDMMFKLQLPEGYEKIDDFAP